MSISYILNGQINEKAIDSIFNQWSSPDSPGGSIGVIKNNELIFAKGYGLANLEYNIQNSINSVFRIGSTSKQFTAACIIVLIQQGKLTLEDTLHSFFPEFPYYAKEIKIKHLLNHTSGIRDYLMIAYLKGLTDADYYQDKDVMNWLVNQNELNFSPGEEYLYSNSGYWLLGQIINRISGMDMNRFAEKEIFEPLQMNSTHFHNDYTRIVKNRVSGYVPYNDTYKISMSNLEMIGDGGIFTTIEDIKKWDDAFYTTKVFDKEFWEFMTKQGVLNNGETIEYASGLVIDKYKGYKTISHSGAFVGYRADLIRFPDHRFSVVIFANRGDANPTEMAYKIADLFLAHEFHDKVKPLKQEVKTKNNLTVSLNINQLVGTYELEPGANLIISIENDALLVNQSWNLVTYPIVNSHGNTYQIENNTDIDFTFSEVKNELCQTLTINQKGKTTIGKRKKNIDSLNLDVKEYFGEYYSEELDITYYLTNDKNIIKLTIGNSFPIELLLIDKDQYSWYGTLLKFNRTNGHITGFNIDAGRIKNIKFIKK
ncbi:MAG: serine hydrolase domain-containing protein [Polaribacter sp.]|uniref:serine hydrolase domain-containing protein n=1 Tax=Polaribacter sp. TaxID=1920175 RepID=UPI003BB12A39